MYFYIHRYLAAQTNPDGVDTYTLTPPPPASRYDAAVNLEWRNIYDIYDIYAGDIYARADGSSGGRPQAAHEGDQCRDEALCQ